MAYSKSSLSGIASDYAHLRTLPALLSVVFAVASLYQFGGIAAVELTWWGGYTLTTEHATLMSAVVYGVAFMSSETRRFDNYQDWEKVAIAAGPVVILGNEYMTEVNDFLVDLGGADPLGMQVAFFLSIISWGVAVR